LRRNVFVVNGVVGFVGFGNGVVYVAAQFKGVMPDGIKYKRFGKIIRTACIYSGYCLMQVSSSIPSRFTNMSQLKVPVALQPSFQISKPMLLLASHKNSVTTSGSLKAISGSGSRTVTLPK
jgi:hypothetical protein